jgi:hypothetical protein
MQSGLGRATLPSRRRRRRLVVSLALALFSRWHCERDSAVCAGGAAPRGRPAASAAMTERRRRRRPARLQFAIVRPRSLHTLVRRDCTRCTNADDELGPLLTGEPPPPRSEPREPGGGKRRGRRFLVQNSLPPQWRRSAKPGLPPTRAPAPGLRPHPLCIAQVGARLRQPPHHPPLVDSSHYHNNNNTIPACCSLPVLTRLQLTGSRAAAWSAYRCLSADETCPGPAERRAGTRP